MYDSNSFSNDLLFFIEGAMLTKMIYVSQMNIIILYKTESYNFIAIL